MGAGTVGGGNRRKRSRFARQPMSEINVTPFVDVMLVLLIIFMVAAPLLTTGVPVDLPKTKAKEIQGPKDPLVLTIAKNGDIFLQDKKDQPLKPEQVVAKLNAITKSNKALPVYLKGDKKVIYDKVAKLMGILSAEGYSKISLITGQ